MAELVLERRAGLRSTGERIREVVRLKELQHHFISYRSKVGLDLRLKDKKGQIKSLGGDCSGCSEGHCSGASPTRGWSGEETPGGFSFKPCKSELLFCRQAT